MTRPPVALYYDADAYVERTGPPPDPRAGGARGLMGRHVAGREFLDAYLTHAAAAVLAAVVRDRRRLPCAAFVPVSLWRRLYESAR